ncbi:hypothetical protein [Yoonia sediminilitoris]|uniref:DUF3592 domain-containing protein n=1 Tax=Yoonia sediminilitoris TaxID=1286148 RepID=A0A2T6KRW4_9RHOB|nr:hypothetical protein [Yoonia sediminilitoris]PUB19298.1 hypothetical protein C8N45_101894 [Yoonia sediminilitoris]RCW99466.1 hypothetical protein DFP92_101894 [Yoonia sediminilitoris]
MTLQRALYLIVSLAAAGMGTWLAYTSYQQLVEAAQLRETGVRTISTVSQKWIVPGESPDDSHRIRYDFVLNDQDYTFERSVPVPLYRVVESGSTFEVTVSEESPDLHEIYPGQLAGRAQNRLTGGIILLLIGIAVFLIKGGASIFRRNA